MGRVEGEGALIGAVCSAALVTGMVLCALGGKALRPLLVLGCGVAGAGLAVSGTNELTSQAAQGAGVPDVLLGLMLGALAGYLAYRPALMLLAGAASAAAVAIVAAVVLDARPITGSGGDRITAWAAAWESTARERTTKAGEWMRAEVRERSGAEIEASIGGMPWGSAVDGPGLARLSEDSDWSGVEGDRVMLGTGVHRLVGRVRTWLDGQPSAHRSVLIFGGVAGLALGMACSLLCPGRAAAGVACGLGVALVMAGGAGLSVATAAPWAGVVERPWMHHGLAWVVLSTVAAVLVVWRKGGGKAAS